MPGRRCGRCGNRVRVRSRRCRHCGWQQDAPSTPDPRGSRQRVLGWAVGGLLVLAALLVIAQRSIEPASIAEWYAESAIQHLPHPFSRLAPAETAAGAFFFCVRSVVRDELASGSVATFPAAEQRNTVALGDGVYRVTAFVYEDRADGARLRREFTCTTRYDRNRWVLQGLRMGSHAQLGR